MVGTSVHDGVPKRWAVVPAGVDLPAGVADVANTEQGARNTGDLDVGDRAILVALKAEVGVGQLAEDCLGVRAPQAKRGRGAAEVGEGNRLVFGKVLLDPVLVAAAIECAGNDTNSVVARLHHGEVGVEATVLVEPRRVGTRADALTDLVDRELLGKVECTRTGQFEYLEGR